MIRLFEQVVGREFECLQEENELVFDVLNSITDGFFLVDNDWKVLYWNKSAEKIMSIAQSSIITKNLWDVFVDTKNMSFFVNYHYSKKENLSIEFELEYKPGIMWLEVRTFPFKKGLAVYFKDITSKKNLAAEIHYSKTQLQAIISSTKDSIWSVDRNYKLLVCNPSYAERVFDTTGHLIKPGDNVLAGYREDIVVKRKSHYDRGLAGESFSIEDSYWNQNKIGFVFLEISFNPILSQDKEKVIGVACYSRDVTQSKQYQHLIEEQNSTLEQRERNLQNVKGELENVLDSSLDLICSVDKHGKFVHVNKPCRNLLGYEPSELMGRHYTDFLCSDDIARTTVVAADIQKGNLVTNFRNTYIKKNGELKVLVWSSRWDADQGLMFAIGRDASALVEAERVRDETEKRFAALIQKGADMISILDAAGNYKFASPSITGVFGYNVSDLLGHNAFEQVHPDDVDMVQQKLVELLETGEIKKVELRFKDASKNYRWIEIVGTNLLNEPAIEGIVINSRDITDRKLQEEELRITNGRYHTVINITNEVIWEWDLFTNKVIKNKNYEKIFGYDEGAGYMSFGELINRIHPDDCIEVKSLLTNKIQDADTEPWKLEYRYIRADGDIAFVIGQGVLVVDKNRKPIRMIGSMRDISKKKKIELEREVINQELIKSNDDLVQFSFITSHNLRAPLSNIIGLIDIVDDRDLNSQNRQCFDLMKTASKQLQDTIQDLSNIIAIRSQGQYGNERVNIEETLDRVRKIYLNTLHDIPYSLNLDLQVKELNLNKSYLESILINLLSNAVKYRAPDRKLQLDIRTNLNNTGESATITVSDNGRGLDLKRLKSRVFGMYQRFHANTEGKGLGLFMVKSQVMAMGGSIELVSEIDKGTAIIINLPIHQSK